MRHFTIGEREYRTDGHKSPISGRLTLVERRLDDGAWRSVRNVSKREMVLHALEAATVLPQS